MSIPLEVRTRLCEPDIALRHLANLKEGDVIPAKVTDKVEILVDGKPFFRSGARRACRAIRLEHHKDA
jgi:flagellar motor switch protein FliM